MVLEGVAVAGEAGKVVVRRGESNSYKMSVEWSLSYSFYNKIVWLYNNYKIVFCIFWVF